MAPVRRHVAHASGHVELAPRHVAPEKIHMVLA
jgi:hypothetical protein